MVRVIVNFFVGAEKKRCRLVLGGPRTALDRVVEVQDTDALGDPRWVQAKNISGLCPVELLVERALVHVLETPNAGTQTSRGIEIELGVIR